MNFSYSGNPSSSDHDQVRFLIGDTDQATAKLSDEEIVFLISEWGDTYLSAAAAADHLAATAASWYSYQTDGASISLSEAQAKYQSMGQWLRAQANRKNRAVWYVGGIDIGDKLAHEADDSVAHGSFSIGMTDMPDAGQQNGGAQRTDLLGLPEGQPW